MKLGIDYGTTTTLISYTTGEKRRSKPLLINIGGNRSGYMRSSIPSIIAVKKGAENEIAIGYEAEKLAEAGSSNVIVLRSLKRCIACDIKEGDTSSACWNPVNRSVCLGGQKLKLFTKTKTVRQLIQLFVNHILRLPEVEEVIDEAKLNSVGICVPAIFGSEPRYTIYDLLLKEFEDKARVEVINEPSAVILACQNNMVRDDDGIYAICDVGGGTTDIVVYEKKDSSYFLFKPVGSRVAGDNIDIALLNRLYSKKQATSLGRDQALMEVRRAKELLTVSKEITVFGEKLLRQDFQDIIAPVIRNIVEALRKAIMNVYDAYKPYMETRQEFRLNRIYLSGGGSKIPLLKDMICRDETINALEPDVDFIQNKELYPVPEDLPIVVVALGTSLPKSGISDTIQFMMPYAINVTIGNEKQNKIPIYGELPIEFEIVNPKGLKIHINAVNPDDPEYPVHRLTDELVSTPETQETMLSEFLKKASSFRIRIDEYNIMRVTTTGLSRQMNRPFPLPWQGGIEVALFEKYRREWRRRHGYA